jgi:hypothetical protein
MSYFGFTIVIAAQKSGRFGYVAVGFFRPTLLFRFREILLSPDSGWQEELPYL